MSRGVGGSVGLRKASSHPTRCGPRPRPQRGHRQGQGGRRMTTSARRWWGAAAVAVLSGAVVGGWWVGFARFALAEPIKPPLEEPKEEPAVWTRSSAAPPAAKADPAVKPAAAVVPAIPALPQVPGGPRPLPPAVAPTAPDAPAPG